MRSVISTAQSVINTNNCQCCVQDCANTTNVRCYEFDCHIGELSAGAYVVIELRARLWNSTFLEVSHRRLLTNLPSTSCAVFSQADSQPVLIVHWRSHLTLDLWYPLLHDFFLSMAMSINLLSYSHLTDYLFHCHVCRLSTSYPVLNTTTFMFFDCLIFVQVLLMLNSILW